MSQCINIEAAAMRNTNFRFVQNTSPNMQLVFMSLLPGQEIGAEVHRNTTQFIRVESGTGIAVLGADTYALDSTSAVVVHPGTFHNIINTGTQPLKLYTLYSPPMHKQGLVE